MGPGAAFQRPGVSQPAASTADVTTIRDHLKVQALIRAYQVSCYTLYYVWLK